MHLFRDIGELFTLRGVCKKSGRKTTFADLGRCKKGAIVVSQGRVEYAGRESALPRDLSRKIKKETSLGGGLVIPALTECHTHSVFAGDRSAEFEMRNQGVSYQEIASRGGGILSTVKKTRRASREELTESAQARANRFLRQGVTTLEIKSGYALSLAGEKKMLEVAGQIRGPRVVRTFLGAHAIPQGKTADQYVEELIAGLASVRGFADRVDIFVEKGYFSLSQAKKYLLAAQKQGFGITIHADQLSRSGATRLGLQMGAHSVDHVVQISKADTARFSGADTVAVLLPAADFYLQMKYPPARELIEAGARVAISTDFNPGSSPTQSVEFVGVLARLEMKMSLPEVLAAYTFNAAAAINLSDQLGSLNKGKWADFIHLPMDYEELFYQVGSWQVDRVVKQGKVLSRR